MADAPDPNAQETVPSGPTWVVPALLWLVLLAGVAVFAFAHPRAEQHVGQRVIHQVEAGGRDVLTGRLAGTDGTPVMPKMGPGSADRPLKLAFIPPSDAGKAGGAIDKMMAWLRLRTGYNIEGAILKNYGLVIEQIVVGECDIAFLTATSYARARYATENNDSAEDDIEAFLSAVRQGNPKYPGSDLAYRAAIIVHKDSPLENVADLTDEHKVAVGPPTSGASYLLPTALFNELGKSPRYVPSGGYMVIITSVLQQSVDAGCIWWSPPNPDNPINDARITVKKASPNVFDDTRIIGYSRWIPNEPVVIRKVISPEIRQAMARALALYVNTKGRTEEGRRELELVGNIVGYIPATNKDYDVLMETIERSFANDPEGRRDFMRGRK